SDATVLGTINTYLASNGQAAAVAGGGASQAWYVRLDGSRVRAISAGSLPAADATDVRGVEVRAGKQVNTYFARVLGVATIPVGASGMASYAGTSTMALNWTLTGVPLLPLAFDIQAWQNGHNSCSGYGGYGPGHPFVFSDYIDTPSDCAIENDMHFS